MNKLENKILDINQNYHNYLMNLENVTGVGYGYKYINNINTLEPCIHVLVKNKINIKNLTSNNIIPKQYMGIKTDVIKVGNFSFYRGNRENKKVRPLKGGCTIGILDRSDYGTMCCIVEKKTKRFFKKTLVDYYILSNNHVLTNGNTNAIGTIFIQPVGPIKRIALANAIAMLDTFVPIHFVNPDYPPVNLVDCAIAKLLDTSLISDEILEIGKLTGTDNPTLEMPVKKFGNSSGLTEGKIITLNAYVKTFDDKKNNVALFGNQIVAKLFSEQGDSGSPIVTTNNKLVGMMMSGDTTEQTTTFNDINIVLKKLNVKLYIAK